VELDKFRTFRTPYLTHDEGLAEDEQCR
jgi:hypothetical protein